MAYSNAEIVKFLIDNPQLTDAQLAEIMETAGVDVSQVAEATGSKVEDIQGRFETRADEVYVPPAAVEEVSTPVTSLLDTPTVLSPDEPPAAPIVETVSAPVAPPPARVIPTARGTVIEGDDIEAQIAGVPQVVYETRVDPNNKANWETFNPKTGEVIDKGTFAGGGDQGLLAAARPVVALAAGVLGAPYLSELIAGSTGLTGSALTGATGATIAGGSTAVTGGSAEDIVKAALTGGAGGYIGSEISNLLAPAGDASLLTDAGITERQLAIADAKQLADQGLTVSQIQETLTANGYNDAIVGRAINAITPATTAPVAPPVAADNVVITAPNVPPVVSSPSIGSVINTLAAPAIETVKVDAPRDKVTPTAPNLTSVINTIATAPIVKPPVETVTVEDKTIKEEEKKVTPTLPTVPELTVTGPRPVVPATPTAPIVPTLPLVLPPVVTPPPAPTPPKPPEPPPKDKKEVTITDVIKTIAPLVIAPAIVNSLTPTKPSYPIVPIPPEWKPPTTQPTTPFQPLTPIDFGNQNLLKGTQWEKFLDPNYGKVPAPTQYAQPSNLSYNDLMGILGSKQGMPPTSSLSINDVISGIQNQYGQVPSGAVGAKPA